MPKNKNNPAPLWVSQNFLTGSGDIRRLLDISDISSQDLVVEIGPGKGHITRQLLPRCKKLVAAELDPRLCQRLKESFGGESRFRLYPGDFLKMPLPKGAYKVFANIPFSSTTAIIRRLACSKNPPLAAWLVVELGAAKRFAGQPKDNLTSLSLRPFFQVRVAARIPRDRFHPMPRCDAGLLELRLRATPDVPLAQQEQYRAFLDQGWKHGLEGLLTRRQAATALRLAGLAQPGEDANMKYVQWLCLFRCWQNR